MLFKRPQVRYADTPQPATPYQAAAQVWDERIGSARVQAHNWRLMALTSWLPVDMLLAALLGLLIGALTFSGSLVAFGKLQGIIASARWASGEWPAAD